MSEPASLLPRRILVVEDEPEIRVVYGRWLRAHGHDVEEATSLREAIDRLASSRPDAVCLDLGLPDASGTQALDAILRRDPSLPVVVLTAQTDVDVVVAAMQLGAFGYLAKPVQRERLLDAAARATSGERSGAPRRGAPLAPGPERSAGGRAAARGAARLLGTSEAMSELRGLVKRVAERDVAVLLQGEGGAGKKLIAHAIHEESLRRDRPFVSVSCATIAEAQQEAELFGHEKGAFPGADAAKTGALERATGGTLLLAEIAALSAPLQTSLLRALQDRSFRRMGGAASVAADFRIVAASRRPLWDEVVAGRFRSDLYYHLAVFELGVPPLRARAEDIVALARAFIEEEGRGGLVRLSAEAEQLLVRHTWPGNVRELKNAVRHALVLRSSDVLSAMDFPERVHVGARGSSGAAAHARTARAAAQAVSRTGAGDGAALPEGLASGRLDVIEREAIERMIASVGGSMTEAARRLGISRATLYRRLKQYQET